MVEASSHALHGDIVLEYENNCTHNFFSNRTNLIVSINISLILFDLNLMSRF